MARKNKVTRQEQHTQATDESTVDTGPALDEDTDRVIDHTPGMGGAADMPPQGDPGSLSTLPSSSPLPRGTDGDVDSSGDYGSPGDLGSGFGATDPGSSLLDDITGADTGRSDPLGDVFDPGDTGWSQPEFEDQSGWARDGGHQDEDGGVKGGGQYDPSDEDDGPATEQTPETGYSPHYHHNPFGDWVPNPSPSQDRTEPDPPPDDDDDDDDGGDGDPATGGIDGPAPHSMPVPPEADDGTGGDPDASDFIGGRGDIDPAPEAEPAGGAGELIGGRGDVDPAPETEDAGGAGGLDMVAAGLGAVDPLEGESSLLAGDTGAVADLAGETDLGDDVEIDIEMVADADVGEGA